jgi:hypothetical protein
MMNSIKMVHAIARHYNTEEKMTNIFKKITNQMIENCKQCIYDGDDSGSKLWEQDPEQLVRNLESYLKLNETYKEQYLATKEKLRKTPRSKQFEFDENEIVRDSAGRGELRVGSDPERGAVATRSPWASDGTPTASTDEPEEVRKNNPRRCVRHPRRCESHPRRCKSHPRRCESNPGGARATQGGSVLTSLALATSR